MTTEPEPRKTTGADIQQESFERKTIDHQPSSNDNCVQHQPVVSTNLDVLNKDMISGLIEYYSELETVTKEI